MGAGGGDGGRSGERVALSELGTQGAVLILHWRRCRRGESRGGIDAAQ